MKDRLQELRRLNAGSDVSNSNGRSGMESVVINFETQTSSVSNHHNSSHHNNSNEKSSLLDPFFEEVEKIQEEIHELKDDVEKVQKLHSFLLHAKTTNEEAKTDMDKLNDRIRRKSIQIKNQIKQLNEKKEELESKKGSTATEVRIRETQISFLQKWFLDLMQDHSTSSADYQEKYKQLMRRQLEVMGYNSDTTTEEELNQMIDDPSSAAVFTQSYLKATSEAKQQLAEVTARHDLIISLEKSIKEVADLFVDMAGLVEAQGEMIDSIERNVQRATDAAKAGQQQLIQAKASQSAARKKKICCYLIIVAVIIGLIALTIVTGS